MSSTKKEKPMKSAKKMLLAGVAAAIAVSLSPAMAANVEGPSVFWKLSTWGLSLIHI